MSLEHPSPPYHPLRLKLPRCARLCVSVIKYLGQTALNQTYSCVSITPVPEEPCTHTARSSVLCPELYTNLCPLSLPSLPQPTEQRNPSGSWSGARCSGSSSLLTQAFSWLCVQVTEGDDHRLHQNKGEKVFGYVLRSLSEKRMPQIWSFF